MPAREPRARPRASELDTRATGHRNSVGVDARRPATDDIETRGGARHDVFRNWGELSPPGAHHDRSVRGALALEPGPQLPHASLPPSAGLLDLVGVAKQSFDSRLELGARLL